eukprot:1160856-Pelagomonas_calceolata.AAC.5
MAAIMGMMGQMFGGGAQGRGPGAAAAAAAASSSSDGGSGAGADGSTGGAAAVHAAGPAAGGGVPRPPPDLPAMLGQMLGGAPAGAPRTAGPGDSSNGGGSGVVGGGIGSARGPPPDMAAIMSQMLGGGGGGGMGGLMQMATRLASDPNVAPMFDSAFSQLAGGGGGPGGGGLGGLLGSLMGSMAPPRGGGGASGACVYVCVRVYLESTIDLTGFEKAGTELAWLLMPQRTFVPVAHAVVVEEPVSDEVISESLGPADAQRWRATLAADQARQAEVQQQQEGQEPAKHTAVTWRRLATQGSQKTTVHKFFKENTQERKNKGTRRAFHLGVLVHIYHKQMCAPAKLMSQLLKCEHVSENVLCFSACACPNQDANTWGQKGARHEQTRVSVWHSLTRKCHPVMILG